MRKMNMLGLICLVATFALSGCGKVPEEITSDKLKVVTTLFPYYDFTRQIAGDEVSLELIIPAGKDSHSFEPTPADMIKLQESDVIIYNGGELEHWMDRVLSSIDTSKTKVVKMMDYIEVLEQEHEEHEIEHEEEEHDHEEEELYDEHIWTSPKNAKEIVETITETLIQVDQEQAAFYNKNQNEYLLELEELQKGYEQVMSHRIRDKIVVADKFPFRYLAKEFDLEYLAAFVGCSTDTEPSAKTIASIIDTVRDEQIPVVYYLELGSDKMAKTIAGETGAEALLLHSCHNVTKQEFDSGVTYTSLMKQNLEYLKRGLQE